VALMLKSLVMALDDLIHNHYHVPWRVLKLCWHFLLIYSGSQRCIRHYKRLFIKKRICGFLNVLCEWIHQRWKGLGKITIQSGAISQVLLRISRSCLLLSWWRIMVDLTVRSVFFNTDLDDTGFCSSPVLTHLIQRINWSSSNVSGWIKVC
jgi:hypothetical protein